MTIDDAHSPGPAPRVGRPLRAPKTAELIAGHLRRQIVRGELSAGDKLPSELRLMEQYGVSRPTLREAFRILETERLISVRRGARGGAEVTVPDVSVAARHVGLLQIHGTTIDDVYQARMVSEPVCAGLLARRRTDQDIADLRACIDELAEMVRAGPQEVPDPARWSKLTYRFHELILERCGNRTLAVQGAVLQDIVATHLEVTLAGRLGERGTAGRFRRTIRSYTKLTDLIEARDAEGAEQHWRNHMIEAGKILLGGDLKNRRLIDLFS